MSNISFEMTGKLSIGKETEKFKPYEEKTFDSGWVKRRLSFNVIAGDNRHMLTIDGGSFKDGHGDVYLFSKGSTDESGKKIKGESFKIPFKERLTSPRLAEVAEFKKYVFDLEQPNRRYLLQKLEDDVHEGKSVTDEDLKKVGLEAESEISEALEKSKKRHHEFVTEWDFAEFVKKVVDSGKYVNKKFFIRGNIVHSYSDSKNQVYENYVPNRIYLADDEAEEMSTASLNLIYNKDSFDDMSVAEKGKYFVNGYVMSYDNNRKANIPVPTTIAINAPADDTDEKDKKKANVICKKFKVEDDTYKELGVVVNMLNGAQKTEITDDMLTDEQKEDLDCGLITEEDIIRDMGGSVYGDRIKEYQFDKIGRGFSKGREDTVYTDDDMVIKSIEEETVTEDLFEDDDL